MKKILSLFLAFSLVVPAYGAVVPVKKVKEFWSSVQEKAAALKEAMGRAYLVLKKYGHCLISGKGEACSPKNRRMLFVIRDFFLGRFKRAREGMNAVIKENTAWFALRLNAAGIRVQDSFESVMEGMRVLASQGWSGVRKAIAKMRALDVKKQ